MTSAATASGSTTQNIQRQPSDDSTAPPMVGPIAGATAITMVIVPMVAPRRWGGTRRITEVISSGSITAVPQACTTRPTSRTPKPGASPLINVPRLNRVSEARKTWRGVNRSSRNPVVGMTTAMVSRNPLVSHCTVVVETPRSTVRSRSATLRIVSLRIITNAETTRTPISRVARGTAAPRSGAAVVVLAVSIMWGHTSWDGFAARGRAGHPSTSVSWGGVTELAFSTAALRHARTTPRGAARRQRAGIIAERGPHGRWPTTTRATHFMSCFPDSAPGRAARSPRVRAPSLSARKTRAGTRAMPRTVCAPTASGRGRSRRGASG